MTGYLDTLLAHARQVPPGIRPRRAQPFEEALPWIEAEERAAESPVIPPAMPLPDRPGQMNRKSAQPTLPEASTAVPRHQGAAFRDPVEVVPQVDSGRITPRDEPGEPLHPAAFATLAPPQPASKVGAVERALVAPSLEEGNRADARHAEEQTRAASWEDGGSSPVPATTVERLQKRTRLAISDLPLPGETLPAVGPREARPVAEGYGQGGRPEVGAARTPPTAPTVEIHIGRIDVRAVAPVRQERPSHPTPALSLDDYLKQTRP